MADLAAFLAARLDDDEEYLRVVVGSIPYQRATAEQATPSAELRAAVVALMSRPDLQALSARWAHSGVRPPNDLARALGEVAAKRAILAEVVPTIQSMNDQIIWEWSSNPAEAVADAHLPLLKIMASVYSDHPDYDPAWGEGPGRS